MGSDKLRRHSRSRKSESRSSRHRHRHRRRSYSRSPSRYSDKSGRTGHRRRKKRRHSSRKSISSESSSTSSSSEGSRSRSTSISSANSETGMTPAEIEAKHELEKLTRDSRTVFVAQLQVKVTEKDIKKFFQRIAKVKNVVLIKDKFTNRSKGFSYVELKSLDDVPAVLELSGQKFIFPNGKEGFPILIKPSEAEKNFTYHLEKKANTANVTYNGRTHENKKNMRRNPVLKEPWDDKIEIKNIPVNMKAEQVKDLAVPFGKILDLDLILDDRGYSTGQCFVHYKHRDDARRAYRKLEGLKISSNRLKVYMMQKGQVSKIKGTTQEEVDKRSGGKGSYGMDSVSWRLEADEVNTGRYGGTGVGINAAQRMTLMSKLSGGVGTDLLEASRKRTDELRQSMQQSNNDDEGPGRIKGAASHCVLIKNLFDPSEETDPEWPKEIEHETRIEAEKHGQVKHIYVDKNSMGNVFICMDKVQNGKDCANAMHGRWFSRRQITVEYINPEDYARQFPESNAY